MIKQIKATKNVLIAYFLPQILKTDINKCIGYGVEYIETRLFIVGKILRLSLSLDEINQIQLLYRTGKLWK